MVVMGNPLGDVKVVNKLLKLGADPMMKDEDGWNCLHWAAYHSNVGAVEVMMENGASSAVMNLLIEKNKDKSYLDQAYDIITLLSNQTKKIPLAKFKDKPISFDLKGLLG